MLESLLCEQRALGVEDYPLERTAALRQSLDHLDLACSFDNTTDHVVTFPEEMCTAVALYYPASDEGIVLCDDED